MTRLSWFIWVLRNNNLPNRFAALRNALIFELFYLWWKVSGRKVTHFLRATPLPEGKYIVTRTIPAIRLTILGKRFCFSEELPVEHVPYTPEMERQVREQTGQPAKIREIFYKLRVFD
jgi:hypothetical protein